MRSPLHSLHLPHALFQQADHSQAALAKESSDSARSATMALDLFNRQAVDAQGQNQLAAANFAASGKILQSQVSGTSSASYACPQHVASGVVSPARQPRGVWPACWSQARQCAQCNNAAKGYREEEECSPKHQVFRHHLDDLDRTDLQDYG